MSCSACRDELSVPPGLPVSRQLLLIRHAQPERVEGVVEGADPGLTDLGRRQANAMAKWLADEDIVAVHSSTARRAVETAEPLAGSHGRIIETHQDLLEFDWGHHDYVPFETMRAERHPRLEMWREILRTPIDEQPEVQAFVKRVGEAIEDIIAGHDHGTIAIVCHGGVINAFAARLLSPQTLMVTRTEYTGFSRLVAFDVALGGTRWIIDTLNEYPHLHADGLVVER